MTETKLYEQQLLQIQNALQTCDNDEDRANLISLESDLKELISLAANLESKSSDEDDGGDTSEDGACDRKVTSIFNVHINSLIKV